MKKEPQKNIAQLKQLQLTTQIRKAVKGGMQIEIIGMVGSIFKYENNSFFHIYQNGNVILNQLNFQHMNSSKSLILASSEYKNLTHGDEIKLETNYKLKFDVMINGTSSTTLASLDIISLILGDCKCEIAEPATGAFLFETVSRFICQTNFLNE